MLNKPLTVEVKDGELHISIGAATLAWAVQNGDWDSCAYIRNPLQFARDIANTLNDESENGETIVHTMLDNAANWTIEQGLGDGWEYEDENYEAVDKGLDIARALLDEDVTENE